MLYIRTDANRQIGTGHVMRCLAIAEELSRQGEPSVFLVSENEAAALIKPHGHRMILLDHHQGNAAMDDLSNLLQKEKVEKLFVDFHGMTPPFSERWGKRLPLIYLGSQECFFQNVRLLVNYSNALNLDFYANTYGSQNTKLLLGVRYAPLREEFHGHPSLTRTTMQNVLITAGGADEHNFAGRLAEELAGGFPTLHFTVLCGGLSCWKKALEELEKRYREQITVIHSPQSVATVMRDCDAAVSAAGTTLYELCACGIPSVCFSFTSEQEKSGRQFGADGILHHAGNILADYPACVANIKKHLARLAESAPLRKKESERMCAYIDGRGCERITREIRNL